MGLAVGRSLELERGEVVREGEDRVPRLVELAALDLRREHSRFVDYWTAAPGQRGVKLDWNATWRNWTRKAADSQNRGRNGAPTRQQQTDDLFDRAFQRAAAADAADAARATIRGELA